MTSTLVSITRSSSWTEGHNAGITSKNILRLTTHTDFIICWTKYKNNRPVGGTVQALRIASEYEIPCFNAGRYENVEETERVCESFIRGLTHEQF